MAKSGVGFTLVELVIVMAVIATLFGVFIMLFDPAKQLNRTRDATRQHDLYAIQSALDTYFSDKNCYPLTLNSLATTYLRSIPKDPITKVDYVYQIESTGNNCPQWVVLYAKLSSPPSTCQLASTCRPNNFSAGNYACIPLGSVNCATINGYTIP